MKFSEALTALIDEQYARSQTYYDRLPGIEAPTRDQVAVGDENIRISVEVMGESGIGDSFYKDPDISFGTFDNCREYGLTVIDAASGWTLCAYEHRNSDNICIEGCPTEAVRSYGPYGGADKYDVLAECVWKDYQTAAAALAEMIKTVRKDHYTTRSDLKKGN